MKKIFTIATLAVLALGSCTKLDVQVESQLTEENFPVSQAAFVAATGTIYQKFTRNYGVGVWWTLELPTDEAIITARNGGYYDQGKYISLHKHTWTASDPSVQSSWEWGYAGISDCNRVLSLLDESVDGPLKTLFIKEVRTMRALFYYYMLDMYGNVPITAFGTSEAPVQSTKADVFKHIEKELLEVADGLSAPPTVTQAYYGRPTKWMAYALLQKMYLNAATYTGKTMYAESVTYGDKIMKESKLTLMSNYNDLFSPTNGPNSETIFAAIYDANYSDGMALTRYTLHSTLRAKYNLPFSPSNAMCTISEFYNTFNQPNDVRNATWLAGLQVGIDGKPIMNGTAQLNLTPEIVLKDEATMDVGPEVGGISRGVRSIKFFPDPNTNSATCFQNNDMPIFRLADVYLMKAEAILRQGGNPAEALALVNSVRTRALANPLSNISLSELLVERGRELAWEGWRRNDLIRFGKYEGAWAFKKGNEGAFRNIFPIPATELVLNKKLVQNPGY
jgi:hypothetical protein